MHEFTPVNKNYLCFIFIKNIFGKDGQAFVTNFR